MQHSMTEVWKSKGSVLLLLCNKLLVNEIQL